MSLTVSDLDVSLGDRRRPVPVLHGVDIRLEPGLLGAVLGPSGSGKSTLLRAIAGLTPIDAGRIVVSDRDVTRLPPERRGVGLVPQDGALFPHLTVAGNVAFGLRGRSRRSQVMRMLELVGVPELAARLPHELSGGQAQRVALARALAPEPDLVLLDEPFSALDAGLRASLRVEVRRVLAETGTSAVLVTHDQGEALSMADRVIVVGDGTVRQVAAPDELYEQPADLETGLFVGEATVLTGDAAEGRVATALGTLALANAAVGSVTVLVRPERIRIAEHGTSATVGSVSYAGHDALIELVTEAGIPLRMRRPAPVTVRVGDRIEVVVEGAVVAFPFR